MMEALLHALSAGGNIAMIAIAVYLWRLDRRVVRLEVHNFGPKGIGE